MSLPTAHQAHTAFDAGGLAGSLPKRRGLQQGHKLSTPEILAHIEQGRRELPDLGAPAICKQICSNASPMDCVHRRSLERVLRGTKIAARVMEASRQRDVADYEQLRSEALLIGLGQGSGISPCGLAAWLTALAKSTPSLQQRPREPAEAANRKSLPAAFASIILRLTQEAVHA